MERAEKLIRSSDISLPVSKAKLTMALLPRVGFTSYAWIARGLPLGASRFGGPADLPAGLKWPRADGRPLLLAAQLNFGTLPIERSHPMVKRLPERGSFCLFLDVDDDPSGVAGEARGVVAMQFDGDARSLVRHDPPPAENAETWTHCHAVTVWPADHHLCLPDAEAVDSPLSEADRAEHGEVYQDLRSEINDLARTRHEVTLLGTPTLFNPDLRYALPDPDQWMLLLQFDGECEFLAGASTVSDRNPRTPSFGSADFVQYFVRKADFAAGRLDRGHLGYMMT
jgi:hypothetical protein